MPPPPKRAWTMAFTLPSISAYDCCPLLTWSEWRAVPYFFSSYHPASLINKWIHIHSSRPFCWRLSTCVGCQALDPSRFSRKTHGSHPGWVLTGSVISRAGYKILGLHFLSLNKKCWHLHVRWQFDIFLFIHDFIYLVVFPKCLILFLKTQYS